MNVAPVESKAQIVGANITTARRLARMSQEQLAELIEVPRTYVSNWERGKYEPSDEYFKRICEALERPIWWFYMDHAAQEEVAERPRRRRRNSRGSDPA